MVGRSCALAAAVALGCTSGEPGKSGAIGGDSAADTGSPADAALTLDGVGQPGPHAVGFRVEELTYESLAGPRSLRLAIWYPTEAGSGEDVRYNGILEAPGVLGDAPPSAGSFPLHVYSHGHQGYAEASGFWMEHLASHGMVVAAPDHTGNTTFDGAERETPIYYLRAHDITAVIDHLVDGGSAGLTVEEAGITASGHSFGGFTLHALAGARFDESLIQDCLSGADTSAYCSTMTEADAEVLRGGLLDARIVAGVSMAPGDARLFGAAGLAELEWPVLHMTGSLDPQTGGVSEELWSALAAADDGHHRVDIEGGGHQTFTDFSGVLESFDGLIEPERGFEIVRSYGLAWVAHQRGELDASPLLSGEREVDAAVTVMP
jgi:predicted dienelactone hydrolase